MEQESTAGREEFERPMEQRRLEEVDEESQEIAVRLHLGKAKGAKSNLHKWMRGNRPPGVVPTTLGIG